MVAPQFSHSRLRSVASPPHVCAVLKPTQPRAHGLVRIHLILVLSLETEPRAHGLARIYSNMNGTPFHRSEHSVLPTVKYFIIPVSQANGRTRPASKPILS